MLRRGVSWLRTAATSVVVAGTVVVGGACLTGAFVCVAVYLWASVRDDDPVGKDGKGNIAGSEG